MTQKENIMMLLIGTFKIANINPIVARDVMLDMLAADFATEDIDTLAKALGELATRTEKIRHELARQQAKDTILNLQKGAKNAE